MEAWPCVILWSGWGLCAVACTCIVYLRIQHASADDHPRRMQTFTNVLASVDWKRGDDVPMALQPVRAALLAFIQHELDYYYRVRRGSSMRSNLFRILAWVFATLGVIAPLASAALGHDWSKAGYLFFAAAGAVLVANELFGGTTGHIRYITAQIAIEQRVSAFALDWEAWSFATARATPPAPPDKGFELLRELAWRSLGPLEAACSG